jgi:HEAT repeat protein
LITVSRDSANPYTCPIWADQSCEIDGRLPPRPPLLPGKSKIDRYLLNFHHEISTAGEYWVEAKHVDIPGRAVGEVHAKLYFRVDGDVPAIPPSNVQPWVDQLKSTDREKRLEAARTLASLAPPSLEAILLAFADNPEFRHYAPLAFHRLHSSRSIKAMADLMKASNPGTFEQMEAARYLAESNDLQWYPLLLDAAQKNPRISSYPAYAAELGGVKMLPVLVDLAKSPDSRLQAVMAMGSTGSRAAIPFLLELLKSPDEGTSDRASYSLHLLTHRTAVQDPQNHDRQAEYIKWSQWWKREGATAPIFKDTECGEPVPLP